MVEADLRSGALITARTALAQGRDLFAVPGEVGNFHAAGANELLRAGANMVLTAKDILDNYSFLYRSVLNMPAYFAAVEHSDFNSQVLDEMGVAARSADFKLKEGRRHAGMRQPNTPQSEPVEVETNTGLLRAPKKAAPQKRTAHLPGEIKPSKAQDAGRPASKPAIKPASSLGISPFALSDDCRQVLALIPDDRAVSTDALMAVGIPAAALTVALTELELSGLVEGLPGNLYIRTGD